MTDAFAPVAFAANHARAAAFFRRMSTRTDVSSRCISVSIFREAEALQPSLPALPVPAKELIEIVALGPRAGQLAERFLDDLLAIALLLRDLLEAQFDSGADQLGFGNARCGCARFELLVLLRRYEDLLANHL